MSFRYIFFLIAAILAAFGNTYISDYIGYTMRTTVAFSAMLLYCIYKYFKGEYLHKVDKPYKVFLISGLIIIVFHLILGHNYFQSMFSMILLPSIFYLFFTCFNSKEKKLFRFAVILFFICNSLMAIWEHYHETYFIPYVVSDLDLEDTWTFRSRAMLGHPLANALIMSTMTLYILASDLKIKTKMVLFALGMWALLCFNTRSGVLATAACSVPLLYTTIKEQKKHTRKYYVILLAILSIFAIRYVVSSDLGGRVVNLSKSDGLFNDNSSLARLEILDFVDYISKTDLLFGNPNSYDQLLISMHQMGIENGVVTIILWYGLIFGGLLIFALCYFYWTRMACLGKINRICIFACYWAIGLTNPHIAYSLAWFYFFFDFFAFAPFKSKLRINMDKAKL